VDPYFWLNVLEQVPAASTGLRRRCCGPSPAAGPKVTRQRTLRGPTLRPSPSSRCSP